MDHNRETDL